MARLNYHHLHYFWAVAKQGNLTHAAARLHVSQSALSTQIKLLEEQLGQPLFVRKGKALQLTEAGHIALNYAETIFAAGEELFALLRNRQQRHSVVLRVGAVATLSRNFQENFLAPLLGRNDVELILRSGALEDLLGRLGRHDLDIVLSNRRVQGDSERPWRCMRIARQPISLVGKPRRKAFRFPQDLMHASLLLPGPDSEVRAGFEALCERLGVQFKILAEVDDMAMLRLLARDSGALALLPAVVVQDELRSRRLQEYCVVPELREAFYAITVKRRFQHPLMKDLLDRPEADVLGVSRE